MDLEVMPIQSLGFVPTGVINDEQSAFGVHSGYLLGQMIKVILEDIGIDSVKNHREHFSGGRTHRTNDVFRTDMVSEIRQLLADNPERSSAAADAGSALNPALRPRTINSQLPIGLPGAQLN